MLKITILNSGAKRKLMVEGKLAGPWVSELESAWSQTRQAGRSLRILVDLGGVTSIDPSGEAALMAMIADGARLTAKGLYCGYVVKQLMIKARKARAHRHRDGGTGARDSSSTKESSRADQHSQARR